MFSKLDDNLPISYHLRSEQKFYINRCTLQPRTNSELYKNLRLRAH